MAKCHSYRKGQVQELCENCVTGLCAVVIGTEFATPFSYQADLLVLSAGGYKFSVFLRIGVPLAIIMWIGYSIVLPLLYDLG